MANDALEMNPVQLPVEQHPLAPFLPPNGRLLMLGSFPPPQKRWCMSFYYPNYTNDMWRVFGLVFFGDALHFVDVEAKTYRKEEIIGFLNRVGVGIFDTASAVRRLQGDASDKFLEVVTPTDVGSLLARMPQCRAMVTTGQKATDTLCQRFGVVQPKVGASVILPAATDAPAPDAPRHELKLYRMPSTSRAYPLSLQKKADAYAQMFREVFPEMFHEVFPDVL